MSSKVLFVPRDVNRVMEDRRVPILEAAGALSAGRRGGRRDQVRAAGVARLQAALLLSEEAGVDRIAAAAMGRLQLAPGVAGALSEAATAGYGRKAASDRETGVRIFGAVGGLIVENLDEEESRRLEAAGFQVFANERVFFVPPTVEAQQMQQDRWHLSDCGATAMHQQGRTGRGSRIGILDTGIDPDHSEFQGKSIVFAEFDRMGRVVGTTPRDTGDHGTHVAGIAAGRTCGVARDADLAVAAVLTYDGSGYLGQIVAGMDWLAGDDIGDLQAPGDVTVINASLGSSGHRDYLYNSVAAARGIGIPFVGSIGNSGHQGINNHGSPGNYDVSIGVGASDNQDGVGPFSDWGTVTEYNNLAKPDLCAPGVNVQSALPGGALGYKSGTSMAAPCVAGAVALLIEEDPSLANDVDRLEAVLYSRVTKMKGANKDRSGRGRLTLSQPARAGAALETA